MVPGFPTLFEVGIHGWVEDIETRHFIGNVTRKPATLTINTHILDFRFERILSGEADLWECGGLTPL